MEIDARMMMYRAIHDDDLGMAFKALSHGLDPRTYIDPYSYYTALIYAVNYKREKIVRLLIPYSDCNLRNNCTTATAPLWAAHLGYTDILKLLLPHTDLTLRDWHGNIEDNANKIYGKSICVSLIQLWKSLIHDKPQTHMTTKLCLQWHEISMPADFYEEVAENWLIVSLDKK